MYTHTNPYQACIKKRTLLSKSGSSKKVYHIELEINNHELAFTVGDNLGIIPSNSPELVDEIIRKLDADGREEVLDKKSNQSISFRNFLLHKANLQKCSFHRLYGVEKTQSPLLTLLDKHKPHPNELARVLLPLMPRFYSIASSSKVYPDELHLTVAYVEYMLDGKKQVGVGSHFLCFGAGVKSTPILIYVQPSNHFTLPEDPLAPIILIGPGTGIAPFRGFLQERIATHAEGPNWLFFGECNEATDFYYGDYFKELEKQGRLRLSTAFSRDQEQKVYVQDRLWEERKSVWEWIQKKCYIYICGDAQKMAKDVQLVLEKIVHDEGKIPEEDARLFLKEMRKERHLLLDVY